MIIKKQHKNNDESEGKNLNTEKCLRTQKFQIKVGKSENDRERESVRDVCRILPHCTTCKMSIMNIS